ncbi:MAG TPA: DinB family protein [Pyrinomonadaceae bacterium]
MDERITQIKSALKQVADDARSTFGGFAPEQLNWKPSEKGWSIGQCFEHIIKTNEQFYPEFERLASGTRKNTFVQNYSPFTGVLGRFLIRAVSEDSKKSKAPSKDIVPPSDISGDIIYRFVAHIDEVNRKIESCAAADRTRTVVSSPFLRIFTYRLDDAYTVLVEHTKRHFRQAKRVAAAEGFPAAFESRVQAAG